MVATSKVAINAILLPPCIPKQSRVQERSDHPSAVQVTQKVMRCAEDAVQPGKDNILRVREYFVIPEFKVPEQENLKTAVAGAAPEWIWRDSETMHPFWAVRRMTEQQLSRARIGGSNGKLLPRFNCTLETQSLSAVCIAIVGKQALNRTRLLEVLFLTSNVPLEKGEELILEIEQHVKAAPAKRTWQKALRDEQKQIGKKQGRRRKLRRQLIVPQSQVPPHERHRLTHATAVAGTVHLISLNRSRGSLGHIHLRGDKINTFGTK